MGGSSLNLEIKNMFRYTPKQVTLYWDSLERANNLRYRLCDIKNPDQSDVLKMIRQSGNHMYACYNTEKSNIVSEFMLENFTGRSAQIHFSMHPDNSLRDNIDTARFGLKEILTRWKNPDDSSEPYLDSLYGMVPSNNRRACIFALKVGWRKLGVIQSACKFLGNASDGMVITVTREMCYGL